MQSSPISRHFISLPRIVAHDFLNVLSRFTSNADEGDRYNEESVMVLEGGSLPAQSEQIIQTLAVVHQVYVCSPIHPAAECAVLQPPVALLVVISRRCWPQ
jgi:hypothetical protein